MMWVQTQAEATIFFQFFHSLPPSFWIWQTKFFESQHSWSVAEFGWSNTINEKCNEFIILCTYPIETFSNDYTTPGWTLKYSSCVIKLQAKMARIRSLFPHLFWHVWAYWRRKHSSKLGIPDQFLFKTSFENSTSIKMFILFSFQYMCKKCIKNLYMTMHF